MSNRLQDLANSPLKGTTLSGQTQLPSSSAAISDSTRNEALLRELHQLQKINGVVNNVNRMVQQTKSNMNKLNESTGITQHLLDKWIRILNQTNYNQELIDEMNQQSVIDQQNGIDDELNNEDDIENDFQDKLEREKELIHQIKGLKQRDSEMKEKIARKQGHDKDISEQKPIQDSSKKRHLGSSGIKNDNKRIAR